MLNFSLPVGVNINRAAVSDLSSLNFGVLGQGNALSQTLKNLLGNSTSLSSFQDSNASNLFLNTLGLSFGSSASIINDVLQNRQRAQSGVNSLLSGIMAPSSAGGVTGGILAGGAPTGSLSKDNPLSSILGDAFKNMGSDGIYSNLLKDVGSGKKVGIFNSLLSSSQGKADLFGGTGKVMGQVSQMLKKPL